LVATADRAGFELVVATLNTTDAITKGTTGADVILGVY
jgi:hypothetical protein